MRSDRRIESEISAAIERDDAISLRKTIDANLLAGNSVLDGWLSVASQLGHLATMRVLLESGVKVNWANHDGETAFSYACAHNQFVAAKILYTHGAEINSVDSSGGTPLDWCAMGNLISGHGSVAILYLLLGLSSLAIICLALIWKRQYIAAFLSVLVVALALIFGFPMLDKALLNPTQDSSVSDRNTDAAMTALEPTARLRSICKVWPSATSPISDKRIQVRQAL